MADSHVFIVSLDDESSLKFGHVSILFDITSLPFVVI